MKYIRLFLQWISSLVKRSPKAYIHQHVKDFPDKWKPRTVYLLGKPNHEWLAGMGCPCGCGDFIELVLIEPEWPRWKLTRHEDSSVSFKPSIWRTVGCKSHFFLKKGYIEWCKAEDE